MPCLTVAMVILAGLVLVLDPVRVNAVGTAEVVLASHTPIGPTTTPNAPSNGQSTSADGAFVTFQSTASDLVAGQTDTNAVSDIFLFERATGAVTLVSHTPASSTTTANGGSFDAVISANGAVVTFRSSASDLVAGQSDTNAVSDVFVFQRATGAVTLASHTAASPTTAANSFSFVGGMSADGAFVAIQSTASDLVAGQSDTNATYDIFLFERATGAVTLVSHTSASLTTTPGSSSLAPSINTDGSFVAFQSYATNVVGGQSDTNGSYDTFVFERATGVDTLVSHAPFSPTTTANGSSTNPVISADGAVVVFPSTATNVVAGQTDTNGVSDVFVLQRATGVESLVSHTSASTTTTANGSSFPATASADGAVVAFRSDATNLVAGQSDDNGASDAFLFERATASVTLVSHPPGSTTTTANGSSALGTMSADGAFVAFQSTAPNLVAGQNDANADSDVFVFQRATGVVALVSHTPAGTTTTANGGSSGPAISANGGFVAFQSTAPNLVAGQSDAPSVTDDVFVFQRVAAHPTPADFDGDARMDESVFRPSSSIWYLHGSGGADTATDYGTTGDIPVPGDYDNNGTTDIAVFRPSTGTWYVRGGATVGFGTTGDIPVPGDYDGNGTTDIAVFRPSTSTWFVRGGITVGWGGAGDIPVPGDYDGNAATDIAVFRPSSGTWFVRGGITVSWGGAGDIPVPGDYDGNATTDTAVFRPSTGTWFVRGGTIIGWGGSGDVPLPLPDAIRRFFFTPL